MKGNLVFMRFLGKVFKAISVFLSCAVVFLTSSFGAYAVDGGHAAILGVDSSQKIVALARYNIAYSEQSGNYVISKLRDDKSGYDPSYYIRRSSTTAGVFDIIGCESKKIVFNITHDPISEAYYMQSMRGPLANNIIFSMEDAVLLGQAMVMNHKPKDFEIVGYKIVHRSETPRLSYGVLDGKDKKVCVVNIRSIEESDIINSILLLAATVLS